MESVFNHTAHKALWNWLSENPQESQLEWIGWKHNGGEYEIDEDSNDCFACDYVTSQESCKECPLLWPEGSKGCCYRIDNERGLHTKWCDETDLQRRSELAAKIRDLPVREGVKCI